MQADNAAPEGANYADTIDTVATLRDQLTDMGDALVRSLPSLVIALIIFVITWLVAKFAVRIARRITDKTEFRESLENLAVTLVKLAIWLVGLMIAAIVVMPGLTPASLLAGMGLGAVAIGFAFQDIFENFLAGVLIMLREKMHIGDIIECEGITGKVEHITLRETYVRENSGEVTLVPNSMLFKNPVEILTDLPQRRHEVTAGVSYDTDLDHAAEVIRNAVDGAPLVDSDRKIDVFAAEFGASSVDFKVRWWAGSQPREGHESRDQVVRAIKKALDDAGIEIPFPYITHTFKEPVPFDK